MKWGADAGPDAQSSEMGPRIAGRHVINAGGKNERDTLEPGDTENEGVNNKTCVIWLESRHL